MNDPVSRRISGPQSRRWTQTEITEMRGIMAAGSTVADAASAVGRDEDEVRSLLTRLRIKSD